MPDDPDADPARRGRQHRRQGSDVLQGARWQQKADRRPRRHHRLQCEERDCRKRCEEERKC